MSLYGSQRALNSMDRRASPRPDLIGGNYAYSRGEMYGGNGYAGEYAGGHNTYSYSKTSVGGGGGGGGGGYAGGHQLGSIHQRASLLHAQCQEYLKKAEIVLQSGGDPGRVAMEAEKYMSMSKEVIKQLKVCALDLRQMGQPSDSIIRSVELCQEQLRGVHYALNGTSQRKKSSLSWEDPGRSFHEAIAWIGQQKRLVETSPWGDTSEVIDQQIGNHSKFHSSIQRSTEVDRARDELIQKGDKAALNALEQEWDSLQKLSFSRTNQLRDLQKIIDEISQEIMWVNEREEEELMFDWGDKNIDVYIPRKQESYSKLMSELEEKEKHLNKLKHRVDGLLKNSHPAADKIEAYMDTLQTQWSWLLQITKCIQVHLKENAAYSQFFKEANETYSKLQKEHENVRKKYTCDKSTPLESLLDLSRNLEKEKERIMENKRQVQHLVNKSKSIVRLRPRNPEEKSSSPTIVHALCDYIQDQKAIFKGNEGILKDNSQRSKWNVTGPGGLDMLIPSVCLLVPPLNPLSVNLANKNEQYYEAILGIWSQLYINIKSLISWQYCLKDINHINSLTITMISKMRPEEYRSIIKSLESHYQEFQRHAQGSEMFGDDEKQQIETQYSGATTHYDKLVVELPVYIAKQEETKTTKTEVKVKVKQTLLTELQVLRQRLEAAESGLSQHLHLPLGEDGLVGCSQRLLQLESIDQDVDSIRDEYIKLKEKILRELEGMTDEDKSRFLRLELNLINQKLGSLEGYSSSYTQRVKTLMALLQALMQSDDVIKVYEARLTEKETTSLDPDEVEDYMTTLKLMKVELEQKSDVMRAMDRELSDTMSLNSEVGQSCPKCELDLSKYSELVGQTSDRWRRLHGQIDNRLLELGKHGQELSQYHKNSSSLSTWINNTRQRQDALQGGKFDDVTVLMEHLNQQKALNCEIKGKREQVEDVVKDASTCAASIKDYELQLASYSAGLETLLNIPIKRTMLQSPATIIMEEASDLQVHYIELLARSNDYYKFLGVMLKNMEELKMRNTRIDLLEEELRLLREGMDDTNQKNQSLADALAKYELELSQSKDKLLSMEEVKMSQAIECSAARENLSTTADEVADLNDRLARLTKQLEEEQRRRRLLEETYTSQQEEYELIIRKRQKELEEVSWAKVDIEKTIKDKEREIERLRMELDDEALRKREREAELSKVRNQYSQEISNLKETYESEIHVTKTHILKMSSQKDEDSLALQLQYERLVSEKRDLEDELKRLRLSMSEVEELRRRSEEELRQQKSAGTEESRNRRELVVQIETIVKERNEDHLRHKEALAGINRTLQDKNKEIALLTQNLEEECRKRRALEAEISSIRQVQIDLKTRYESSLQIINKLKVSEEEVSVVRVELAKQSSERSKAEKSVVGLQSRIKDLQKMFEAAEAESEAHKKTAFEEANRRKRVESELERVKVSFKEHTTTISVLKKQQEETTSMGRRSEQELKNLQDNLDKSLRDHKATTEKLIQLSAELKALQQQLVQEQARVREANLRNETLYKTIEEKSKLLNDNATEIEKLQSLTQNLTKERLKLEEEVRALRQERDELKNSNESSSRETIDQISSLKLQLQSSSKVSLEYKGLIEELSREREKLKLEIEKIQKQALETSGMIQESQAHYDVVLKQRDSLQLKIKLIEQEKLKMQQYGEELSRVKVTLESELRLKQRLQEENNQIRKDFEYWKSQYELKESLIRQHESEKGKMEKDRDSLRMEVERLLSELKLVEERYKIKLQSTETEMRDLASLRDSLEAELRKLRQRPDAYSRQTQTEGDTVDAGALLFDGIRRKVTAHQLCDCGIIDKVTLGKLLKGEKTVPEVALNIRVNLKGTGVIAGVDGPEGRMSFTELRNKELLTPESASKLLEAQAATGFIIDPRANEKMSVDVAVTKHLVDFKDRDMLLTAENACTGFKDPASGKFLSAGQAMKKGWIDRESVLRLLQAQECVGGIIDPVLSVFLPKDAALDRDLIDEELYSALNKKPRCYIDPATEEKTGYVDLKKKCRTDSATGLLLLPAPEKPITVKGLRRQVSVNELVESQLLEPSDVDKLRQGKLSSEDIEIRLRQYLQGSTCIAGIFDEANDRIMPIYQAMKEGLLRPGSTLELLEAQAASGFVIDPINNLYLTVEEACKKGLFNKEYKQKLLSAERAVTGYKDPETGKLISLFQAIDMGLIEKGHGIRLLEAQIASGGIIDPKYSHRIDVDVAYKRGYFDKEMNDILCDDGDDTKGFFDPNTQENLTYLQLKSRCITDKSTGLVLLPIKDKKKQQSTQKNTLRKRRVVIVDPDTNKEMTVKEAYDKQLIDYETFLELSGQECEWEEITITAGDGTKRYIIIDRKTGIQYDIEDSLEKGLIDRASYEKYRSGALTLTQFADTITSKARPERPVTSTSTDSAFSSSSAGHASLAKDTSPAQYTSSIKSTSSTQHTSSTQYTSSTQQHTSSSQYSSSTQLAPPSPTTLKHIASVSITLASASEVLDEQSPVAAIFDSEKLEKISIAEALDRGLLDSITAQRLLEAQACTGGIINHTSGKRLSVQEAARQGIIGDEMATRLKPAQKAYLGFEDVKTKRKMSAVEAMKERWLPYEAGQRFLEFQYVTGGLIDPEVCQRRTIEDVIQRGWLDGRAAQKLQDTRHHTKNLTCPKTKLKISYKEAMDNCMVEEDSGLKMLQATSVSSKGISSPYNVSSAPGSKSSSRTGSRSGSRRGSVDMSSRYTYSYASFSSRSVS